MIFNKPMRWALSLSKAPMRGSDYYYYSPPDPKNSPDADVWKWIVGSLDKDADGWRFTEYVADYADGAIRIWMANNDWGVKVWASGSNCPDGLAICPGKHWNTEIYEAAKRSRRRLAVTALRVAIEDHAA